MPPPPASTARFLLDCIVPQSADGSRPSLADLDFPGALASRPGMESFAVLATALEQEGAALHQRSFGELGDSDKKAIVDRVRKKHLPAFNQLATLALQYYYHHPRVLHAVGAGSTPPFPEGNHVAEGDLTLLEPVYERGRIFR